MIKSSEVVLEARRWINTPYMHQARTKGVGVDCFGILIGVARGLGIVEPMFDKTGYSVAVSVGTLIDGFDKYMTRVKKTDVSSGHVIVLALAHKQHHIAIVADYLHGGLSMIHALGTTDGKGKVVEQRLSSEMMAKLVQAYALPGVIDA